jgi:hypothetical protein
MRYLRIVDDDGILDGQDYFKEWCLGTHLHAAMGVNVGYVPPTITAISLHEECVRIEWTAVSNWTYSVLWVSELTNGQDWAALTGYTRLLCTQAVMKADVDVSGGGQRFYRIQAER